MKWGINNLTRESLANVTGKFNMQKSDCDT